MVGAGTIARSHGLRMVEKSSAHWPWRMLRLQQQWQRVCQKNCADVQIRATFMAVRKFEARCLMVYPCFWPMRAASSHVCLKASVKCSIGSRLIFVHAFAGDGVETSAIECTVAVHGADSLTICWGVEVEGLTHEGIGVGRLG